MSSWGQVIGSLDQGQDLTAEQAHWAMTQIMSGDTADTEIVQFLVGLRTKTETTEEVSSLVDAMLEHCVEVSVAGVAVDVVGTGGDHANTVNISTMAAITAAGAGVQVVKHGNRAVSSKSGAADLLEALGVDIEIDPNEIPELVEQVGIGFCYAPKCHPAMAHAVKARKQVGVSTVFNLLGPLANPARPKSQVIGVADSSRGSMLAEVSRRRGVKALIVHSLNGLDEFTSTSPVFIWDATTEIENGEAVDSSQVIEPKDLGFAQGSVEDLVGGTPADNALIAQRLFAGERDGRYQTIRDAVVLSAAAALVAHEAAVGVTRPTGIIERLAGAVDRAATSLDSGAARAVLEDWVSYRVPVTIG